MIGVLAPQIRRLFLFFFFYQVIRSLAIVFGITMFTHKLQRTHIIWNETNVIVLNETQSKEVKIYISHSMATSITSLTNQKGFLIFVQNILEKSGRKKSSFQETMVRMSLLFDLQ